MAKMNFKDALNKSLQTTKKYVDDQIVENKFSGDYNDLENRPCYDDRILITSFTSEEADNTILSGGDTAETFMVVDKVFPKIDPEKEYIVKLNGKEFTSYAMYVDNVNTFEDMPGYRNFPEGHYGIFLTTNEESLVFVYIVPNAEIGEDNRATPSETKSLIGFWDGMGSKSLKVEGLIEIYEAGGELKQLDKKFIPFETEEETFNRLLEAGLILGSVELEDGDRLVDNDGNIIIF